MEVVDGVIRMPDEAIFIEQSDLVGLVDDILDFPKNRKILIDSPDSKMVRIKSHKQNLKPYSEVFS